MWIKLGKFISFSITVFNCIESDLNGIFTVFRQNFFDPLICISSGLRNNYSKVCGIYFIAKYLLVKLKSVINVFFGSSVLFLFNISGLGDSYNT